jgi:hypothetical protein
MSSAQTEQAQDRPRLNQHEELMPPVPPDPVSDADLRALFDRLEDPEQGLDAMRLALWPGWWSIDMTGIGRSSDAARRAWGIGHGEGRSQYVVLVYDIETAGRLGLTDATREGVPPPAAA